MQHIQVRDGLPSTGSALSAAQVIYNAVVFVFICTILLESRGTVLLRRRAQRLRRETGDMRYKAHSEENKPPLKDLIRISLSRPLWFLVSEPVVTAFSLWVAFAWCVLLSCSLVDESLGEIQGSDVGTARSDTICHVAPLRL